MPLCSRKRGDGGGSFKALITSLVASSNQLQAEVSDFRWLPDEYAGCFGSYTEAPNSSHVLYRGAM